MSEKWQYPDHYVRLECPDCGQVLATAKRALDKPLGCWCYECGTDMTEEDIVEYGPSWDQEA